MRKDRDPDLDEGRSGLPAPPQIGFPEDYAPMVPYSAAFDALYGLEMVGGLDGDEDGDGALRGRVAIRDDLRQPSGLLHGGVIAAAAEALASRGTWLAVHEQGKLVMGMSNDTSFVAPLRDGHLNATATPRHRGPTSWLWEVEAFDDQGRLCAITTVNVAIRPHRQDPPGQHQNRRNLADHDP
jgi:uncharacterized protein (TIGR00369 family)